PFLLSFQNQSSACFSHRVCRRHPKGDTMPPATPGRELGEGARRGSRPPLSTGTNCLPAPCDFLTGLWPVPDYLSRRPTAIAGKRHTELLGKRGPIRAFGHDVVALRIVPRSSCPQGRLPGRSRPPPANVNGKVSDRRCSVSLPSFRFLGGSDADVTS